MISDEAIDLLSAAFGLEGAVADEAGNLVYEFTSDFPFAVSEQSVDMLRLSAVLPGLGGEHLPRLRKRLLNANVLGSETGSGRLAPDPLGTGEVALVDYVALGPLDEAYLKLRVVDFMLFVEYWRSEGVRDLLSEIGVPSSADPAEDDDFIIRA